MNEWKKYTGTSEQLDEMLSTESGFIVDSQFCVFKDKTKLLMQQDGTNRNWLSKILLVAEVKHFLICATNPLADMICKQTCTGQPVFVKVTPKSGVYLPPGRYKITEVKGVFVTDNPDWFMPGAQYSFTQFED